MSFAFWEYFAEKGYSALEAEKEGEDWKTLEFVLNVIRWVRHEVYKLFNLRITINFLSKYEEMDPFLRTE